MALIVETGVVVPNADAYIDTVYADQYHSDRGNTAWDSADQPSKEAAIRKATQFLDMRYLGRWKGVKRSALQSRQFPRVGIVIDNTLSYSSERFDGGGPLGYIPSNVVPEAIKHASCELSLRALKVTLAPDLPRGGRVQTQKVDVIETTYFADAPAQTIYEMVDLILGEFIQSNSVTRIVRS